MARLQREDRGLKIRLDELEARLFQLKILYEKYFGGLERLEPSRERDDVRRIVVTLERERMVTTAQRYRFSSLKARFTSIDMYIQRNLVLIERGTHPKFKFRADLSDRARGIGAPGQPPAPPPPSPLELQRQKEEEAYQAVHAQYLEARRSCGQGGEVPYADLRQLLSKQQRALKTRFQCENVRFKVVVEDGQARIKAVPMVKKSSLAGGGTPPASSS